jgi:radical SAM protein with 4Fe4S-binding SPASM domain
VNNIARPVLHRIMDKAAKNLVPLQVSMELTHRCNLACKHCYIDIHESEELSLVEIKSIIDQLADAGSLYLMFTGGEPLMRKDFFDIAFYARKKGFLILLMTNGTLITPEIAEKIQLLEPVSVGMSLHGAQPETHDSITGKKGSFASTINAIRMLRNLKIPVSLQTLLMDTNVHEAADMKLLAQELGAYLKIGHQLVPARSGSPGPLRYAVSAGDIHNVYESGLLDVDTTVCETGGICKAGKGSCSISPGGDVFPCLLLPMKLGNLRENRFDEIWRLKPSSELIQLRSITMEDFPDCKICELTKYCNKCIGVFYSETGKLTEPAPSTCRTAALKYEFLYGKGVVV